ncbi:hypothetical protein QPK31_04510 [Massilia sp. YIM B02769]|uniref:hypothetical protein n=1 Tax=unclassified Massilia TaxID=2609279 RepID=UPI0025B658DE|nr:MULTISPECIES: hypothetical protein [unclassified Massilia]MDN4057484.1 hypothetical protein [Massilia sp. YIM B02769]
MRNPCLLAGVILLLAACATPSDTEPGKQSRKERAADAYAPTGTLIPRKKTERGAVNTSEVDKQAFENERMNSNGTNNGVGR